MILSEALAIAMDRGWTLTHKGSLRTLTAPDGRGWICVTSDDVWAVLRVAGIVEGGATTDHRQAEYEARRAYLEEHGLPGNDPVAFAEACTGRKLAPMPDYSDLPDGVLSPEGEAQRFRGLAGLAAREAADAMMFTDDEVAYAMDLAGVPGTATHAAYAAVAKATADTVTVTLTRQNYELTLLALYDADALSRQRWGEHVSAFRSVLDALKAQGGAK
jgi:hypothetical protein